MDFLERLKLNGFYDCRLCVVLDNNTARTYTFILSCVSSPRPDFGTFIDRPSAMQSQKICREFYMPPVRFGEGH